MRRFDFARPVTVGVSRGNRSTAYAARWLERIGVEVVEVGSGEAEIVAGGEEPGGDVPGVVLWDHQVGRGGTGHQASAASGVSWVIGLPGRPPVPLAAEIPEKWCGLMGATMALAELIEPGGRIHRFEISAADILRSFAEQNASNHVEIDGGWRRNGRLAVEHGGIYPQGFYPCADGYVGVVARSKRDWGAVLEAIGDPPWSRDEAMRDPFALALDDSVVDPLLRATLAGITRDDLLERAIETGATIAPVYTLAEIPSRNLVRDDIDFAADIPLPFDLVPW
jgi:crotonobetainyl-CoA:carnitine CoA-transferase CaiB-like acyl-CoA transferase